MSWYRTYRPTTIAGLHIMSVRETLQHLLDSGQFPHALLFAGPKGTGKTSAARILGALFNDPANAEVVRALFFSTGTAKDKDKKKLSFQDPDPADEIVQHIQRGTSFVVQEMDAASNRGIDDIRLLRERIFLPPQQGLISVYILDEVHMLTTEAFNALLKILEEPPQHVMFILATTELHKIPDTIVSRCTLVPFRKASDEELLAALTAILQKEKIAVEPDALKDLIRTAEGSFRDAVKLLETVAAGQLKLTREYVQKFLHQSHISAIDAFVQAIIQKDERALIEIMQNVRSQDLDQRDFYLRLLEYLHQQLLLAVQGEQAKAKLPYKISHYLITQFMQLKIETTSGIPFLSLELKALELILKAKEKGGQQNSSPGEKHTSTSTSAAKAESNVDATSFAPVVLQYASSEKPETISTVALATPVHSAHLVHGEELAQKWEEFLQLVKMKNSSIAALLRSSKLVAAEQGKAEIEVYYQFHRETLQQPKFRALIDECVEQLTGGTILFEFKLAAQAQSGAVLSTISGEVNEEEQLIKLAKEILV